MKNKLLLPKVIISVLLLFFIGFQAFADGSRNLFPSTATATEYRALLQTRNPTFTSSVQFDPFSTLGTMKVYANAGEVIYVGSSAQGITSGSFTGTINLRAPNGDTYSSGTSTTIGKIDNRTQELNGPKRGSFSSNANYYTPYTRTVGAGQAGIWEVDFVPSGDPAATGITNNTDLAANMSWTGTDLTSYQNGKAAVFAFDVSIGASGSDNLYSGRVFCNNLNLNMRINAATGIYAPLYVLTNAGYVYYMNTNGLNGGGFNIFSNNKGPQIGGSQNGTMISWRSGEPSYVSIDYGTAPSSAVPVLMYDPRLPDSHIDTHDHTHKLFFTKPDMSMPDSANIRNGASTIKTWLMHLVALPEITNLKVIGVEGGVDNIVGPDGAYISFSSNVEGKYKIKLTFPLGSGFVDRILEGECVEGNNNLVLWDGKDKNGVKVSGSTQLSILGAITAGEVHFPLADVEHNSKGMIIELLKPVGTTDYISYYSVSPAVARKDTVYWHDSNITGGNDSPLLGSPSTTNGHKWPSALFGDLKILNTWSYVSSEGETITSTPAVLNLDLAINSISPGVTSTVVGNSITYTIVISNLTGSGATADAVGATFGFEAPTGFTITGYTLGSGTGTFVENSHITGVNTFTSNFNLTNGGTQTYTITGTVGVELAHTTIAPTVYVIRPADVTDVDATSAITGAPGTTLADAQAECDAGTVGCNNIKTSVSTTITNTTPVAVDDAGSVDEDATLNVTEANGVIDNSSTGDTDVDGDNLIVSAIRTGTETGSGTSGTVGSALSGTYGALTLNENGSYSYVASHAATDTLAVGETVTDTFTYTISDGNGGTDIAQLVITITGTNDAPVAVDDDYTVDNSTSVILNPLALDTDIDGDPLSIVSINGTTLIPGTAQSITVTNGTVNITVAGVISFTPTANFVGDNVTFPYVITDGHTTTTANQIIDVTQANKILTEISVNGSISESVAGTSTGSPDEFYYATGTSQVLTPVPNPGYIFVGWIVDGVPTTGNANGTLNITMDTDKTVEALFTTVCAWRTTADATDWAADIWEGLDCATGNWIHSTTPPTNDRPTYIFHTVDIPDGSNIVSDSLRIETTGRLEVCGSLTIDNEVIFKVDENGKAGQLINNCGANTCTVTMGSAATAIVRKAFVNDSNVYPWSFVSFPFNVDPDSIFVAETRDKAAWGNLTTANADFFIGEYDGQKRANDGFTNGSNYVNVPDSIIIANKGYILAGGNDFQSVDFKSVAGAQFACVNTEVTTSYYAGIRGECDHGWNLVGAPFVSGYNLKDAVGNKPYYVFDATAQTYNTVMAGDDYLIYPFSSFFVQNLGDADGVTFMTSNQTFKAVKAMNSNDEISLVIANAVTQDKTRIRLQEDASVNFERYKDGIKLMSPVMSVPQIYTEAPGSCAGIAFNALPSNTKRVDLKVRTGKADTYAISMIEKEKLNNVKKVVLVDNETKAQTNLFDQSYTYETNVSSANISSRFYILVSGEEANGINYTGNGDILIRTNGKKVTLSGLNGNAAVNMYDAVGKLVYQYTNISNDNSFNVNIPGMYIMDISTETQNVRIKLLVNNN